MEEIEARKIQKLADFYSALLDIEKAFDGAQKEIETKYSIANNFDLENPDVYIKLIRPVSKEIQNIANTCTLARYRLKEYKALDSQTAKSSKNSPKSGQKKTKSKSPLTLEQRLSRLEFLVFVLYCLLIGAVLGIVIPMLFTLVLQQLTSYY